MGLEEAAAWAGCSVEVLSQAVASGALLHETRRIRGLEVPHVRFVDLEALVEGAAEPPDEDLAPEEWPPAGPPAEASAEPGSPGAVDAGPLASEEPSADPARPGTPEGAAEGVSPEPPRPADDLGTAATSSPSVAPGPPEAPGGDAPASALEVRVEELLLRLEASERERRAQAAALLMTNRRLLELAGPAREEGPGRLRALGMSGVIVALLAAGLWWSDRAESRWERRLAGAEALGQERLEVVSGELTEQRARLDAEQQARLAAEEASARLEAELREELAALAREGAAQAQALREDAALRLSELLDRQERERQDWARRTEARDTAQQETLEQLLEGQREELARQEESARAERAALQGALEAQLEAAIAQGRRERESLQGTVATLSEAEAGQRAEVERLRSALLESEVRLGSLAAEGEALRARVETAEREAERLRGSEPAPGNLPWGVWLAERLGRSLGAASRSVPPPPP